MNTNAPCRVTWSTNRLDGCLYIASPAKVIRAPKGHRWRCGSDPVVPTDQWIEVEVVNGRVDRWRPATAAAAAIARGPE